MDLGLLVLFTLFVTGMAQPQQGQGQFRQQHEPQFQPPPPLQQNQPQQQIFNFQQQQQPSGGQQRQFQQQNFQQEPQAQAQQQPSFQQPQPQDNFATFNARQQQETLPTLPPVFIPPNSPQGPPPQLQSPIRNLFRQPESTFSLSNIISRFFNLFNLNSN